MPDCVMPTVKFGGGSVMIWGSMTSQGVGEMYVCEGRMNAVKYIDMLEQVLEPSVVKFYDTIDGEYYFQQDNAPCHTAQKVVKWFAENRVRLLDWPPQSPDLSPIENLWHILKERIRQYRHTSKGALKEKILQEWESISPDICYKLVATMPKRVKAVIRARGGSIKY